MFAVFYAAEGKFVLSCYLIIFAMLMDGIDGRLARLFGSGSSFGAQLDSLADVISFGVAPGLIIYFCVLQDFASWAWMPSIFYTLCTAIRLARFNTNLDKVDPRFFQGLPSPAAAGAGVCLVWLAETHAMGLSQETFLALFSIAFYILGFCMVSTVPFYSFKNLKVIRINQIFLTLGVAVLILFVVVNPPVSLSILLWVYILVSILLSVFSLFKGNSEKPSDLN